MRKTLCDEMSFKKNSIKNKFESDSSVGESGTEIYCICRSSFINTFMISCDNCQEWFHGDCVGVSEKSAKNIDLYFCKKCQELNSNLQTTYKSQRQSKRRRRKPIKKRKASQKSEILEEITIISNANAYSFLQTNIQNNETSKDCKTNEERIEVLNKNDVNQSDKHQITNDAELASIFEMDTTRRKAKTIANENLKQQQIDKYEEKVKKKKKPPPKQCYGPECVKAARDSSKYCSDECGIKLAKNRILEILPTRIQQRKILPCAADESSRCKLAAVRQQQKKIHRNLEEIETKISLFLQLAQKSRNSRDDMVFLDDFEEEHSALECKLCGAEIPTRLIVKHLENCYKKQERRLMLTGLTTKPDDEEWAIFCNQKMGRQGYCKQLRVLCPFHNKDSRHEDEPCGYPLQMDLLQCQGKFCGRSVKNCSRHPSCWEDIFRAEFDMEKLQLLLKLSELEREEVKLRREMAARGNLVALMLHNTIMH